MILYQQVNSYSLLPNIVKHPVEFFAIYVNTMILFPLAKYLWLLLFIIVIKD